MQRKHAETQSKRPEEARRSSQEALHQTIVRAGTCFRDDGTELRKNRHDGLVPPESQEFLAGMADWWDNDRVRLSETRAGSALANWLPVDE